MKATELAKVFEKFPNNQKEILEIVKKRKLEFLLPKVLQVLNKKATFSEQQNQIILETPFKTSSEAKKKVEEKLGLKIGVEKINKSLIAGFRVYTKDKILDATLDTLLKQIIK